MYFQIAGDCLPAGDFDRAELGSVDPFRYLDVAYEYTYQFRSKQEVAFLHEGAAINLLCHLAQAIDLDECSGSTIVADFRSALARSQEDDALQAQAPDLHAIYKAYRNSRTILTPAIQQALQAAFLDFRSAPAPSQENDALQAQAPDFHTIYKAYRNGRFILTPAIQQALQAAFFDSDADFYSSLACVLSDVILPTFSRQF